MRNEEMPAPKVGVSSFLISTFSFLIFLFSFFILFSCTQENKYAVDKLNSLSYACHYRDVDSTEIYANRALDLSDHYEDGRAEALNNLAFVSIVRMDYPKAEELLNEAISLTDNQVELFISEVLRCVYASAALRIVHSTNTENALSATRNVSTKNATRSPNVCRNA